MSETDTATRVLEILDELNTHRARYPESAYTIPEYDTEKTRTLVQGAGVAFVALNTIFRYDPQDGYWIFQDFGGNETYLP